MKINLLFSFFLLAIGTVSWSQRLDYDHSSKWFFGINAGATWSCTDVKNETNGGWGLTLGKSYNWKTGRRISFDLRARYLHGNWYGQDWDTSNLNSYISGPLSTYKDTFNMTAHNFLNEQHRLAFELVLHANRFAERTNWDPYIFGGIGVTWRQTWSNLLLNDTGLYQYPTMLTNGNFENELSSTLDNTYDTRLDNPGNNEWSAKWMPSLGVGIGYNVGPRFQIGLEHKTTFTGIDDWDGVISSSRKKNDWYHYTSAYLQFRFRTRDKEQKQNDQNNNINNINNYTTPCNKPTINVAQNSVISNTENFTISFTTTNISDKSTIMVKDATGLTVPYNFNAPTNTVSSGVVLKPGVNRFTLYVQNECGSATETIEITYSDCRLPVINFSGLFQNGTSTTRQSTINLSAIIQNVEASGIMLYVNGFPRSQFTYNALNDALLSTISLNPGINTIKIEASNPCGQTYVSSEVVYDNCITPELAMVSPSTNGTSVSTAAQTISVSTIGFNGKNEFSVLLNGQNVPNFTWSNNTLTVPVNLAAGMNTITVNGTNRCGSESVVITLNYLQCQTPVITLQNPSTTSVAVSKAAYTVKFKTQNQTSTSLMVNNLLVRNYTYNAATGLLEYTFNLTPGSNIVTLTSSNGCGVDIETINITYNNCTTPSASITSSGGTVAAAGYNFTASTSGVATIQEIKLTQNGVAIPFTFTSGLIQAITSLVPGANTFVVTVTNACGTQTQTQTVTYNNCLTPSLGLLQPAASGITVNQNQYLLQFTAENVMNASEVSLKVNGAAVSFQLANGIISANVSLNAGINTVTVSVKNTCGSDTETLQISYKQCLVPSIVFNTPAQLSTTTQQNMVSIDLDAVNCTVSTQVTIMRDGVAIPFNFQNGKITLNPVLNPGLNTFIVTATNTCGNDIAKLNVTYDNCVAPKIVLSAPIPATTSNATLAITANLQQITNAGQAILLVNGTGVPFTFNAGTLTANVPLIDGVNTISISATNRCGTDLETNTITYNACKTPVIAITSPVNSGSTVASANLTFTASVAHITQSNQITLILNGNPVTNFQFSNGILQAPLTLVNGINTVVISANSGCGIAQEATTISLSTCSSPSVTIQTMTGQTVSNNSFSIAATVQEIANAQGLSLMVNGQLTPISLVNGAASATVTLQNGLNTLLLSATNACGTDTKSILVTYVPCTAPTIAIQNTNNTVVNAATYAVNATVTGVTQGQITMTLNGNPVNNFTLNGTQFTANVTLAPGENQIVITAQNTCGFDRKDLTVTYQNCTAPQISVNSGNDTVAQGIYTFSANVSNMPTVQGISLSLNGQAISNFSFVNGLLTANVNLANGSNTFALAAANACGAMNATSQVYYDHCQQPVITVTSVLQTSDGQYLFEATLLHVTDIEGVFFTFNGQNVPFNFVNGQLSATVTLNPGSNTFYISAGNNCGTDTETATVNFANCNPPSITLIAPSTSNTTVASAAYVVTFSSLNTQNSSEITITQNGMALSGVVLAGATATLPVILQVGVNVFNINVNNGCGFDQSSFTITYTLPNNNNNNNGGKPNNNNNNNGGKPIINNGNNGKPIINNKDGGGKIPVNNNKPPVKQSSPKEEKPQTNTPAPAPVKKDPPKDVKPATNTPAPAPVKSNSQKEVKPATNTPAPAPVKSNPPKEVKPAVNTPAPVKPNPTKEEKKPEKGGGK